MADGPGATDTSAEKFKVEAELRWPTVLAILVALALYALLPSVLPDWVRYGVIGVCLALLIPVFVLNPHRLVNETRWARRLAVTAATVLLVANMIAFVELVFALLNSDQPDPRGLLLAALEVWITQAIAFAVIYWEMDRGGPVIRRKRPREKHPPADFRFPQDEDVVLPADAVAAREWRPAYFDYLYFSATNSMAFSPTDVLPLSHRAKALMLAQSIAAFVLLTLVIARAVNILS